MISWSTYLREHSAEESENGKDEVVRSESIGHTDDDQRPLTVEKDRLTTELVRKNGADYGANHEAKDEYRLSEVLQIRAITDEIPLYNGNSNSVYRASVGQPRLLLLQQFRPSVRLSVCHKETDHQELNAIW